MRVMIIADRLMTAEVWKEVLGTSIRDRALDTVVVDTAWPDEPFISNAEIGEFLGSEDEIARRVGAVEAILTHHGPVSKKVLDAAPRLKLIGCARTGPTNVNAAEATRRGIPILYSPGHNSPAVAEFTVGLMLALVKRIPSAHQYMRQGVWRGDYYRYDVANLNLSQMTVGLIGLGAIGRLVLEMLKPFGSRVIVHDPFVQPAAGLELVSLEDLLRRSDIVSLHARLTPQTRGMMGTAEFALMKRGSFFLNTARGGLVDYPALYAALAGGHLAGAALDCFESEPVKPGDKLLALENVVMTPHIAGASKLTAHRAAGAIAQDMQRFLESGQPLNCTNRQVLKGG
jgi:D-3-phosphoglycerate dehydrogenase / 2-oxoglutarate reductase